MKQVLLTIAMLIAAGGALAQEDAFVYNDHGKRDPCWPLVKAGGAVVNYDEQDLMLTDMVLEGIMTGEGGQNIAIINGMIVKPNDAVGLFVVKSIAADAVVLQKGEEAYTLKIKKEE